MRSGFRSETESMTTEQYQKRIQFLEYIKNNFIAFYGYQLIFYFENYDISTITAEYYQPGHVTCRYEINRKNNESGAIVLTHGFENHILLTLVDKYISILYDLTLNSVIESNLRSAVDIKLIKIELQQLGLVVKGK